MKIFNDKKFIRMEVIRLAQRAKAETNGSKTA